MPKQFSMAKLIVRNISTMPEHHRLRIAEWLERLAKDIRNGKHETGFKYGKVFTSSYN